MSSYCHSPVSAVLVAALACICLAAFLQRSLVEDSLVDAAAVLALLVALITTDDAAPAASGRWWCPAGVSHGDRVRRRFGATPDRGAELTGGRCISPEFVEESTVTSVFSCGVTLVVLGLVMVGISHLRPATRARRCHNSTTLDGVAAAEAGAEARSPGIGVRTSQR